MTSINPVSFESVSFLNRIGGTPPTTDSLRAILARRSVQAGTDGAKFSGSPRQTPGLPSVEDAKRGLVEMSDLLDQLKAKIDKLASGEATPDDAQKAIDDLVKNIDAAADRTGLNGGGGDGFSLLDVAKQVTNLMVYNVNMLPGQEQQVDIDVRTSAQQAGLFMDLKGGQLDLGGASESFTIEISGREGTVDLTFSSGTSAGNIAKAINSMSKETGVEARLSGSGIRLDSHATGSGELISVRVIDDGGASDDAGRFYRLKGDAAGEADTTYGMTFDSLIAHSGSGIRDHGQDAVVYVNGEKASGYGSVVFAKNDKFTAMFFLERGAAAGDGPNSQKVGRFTGFTIKADGGLVPSDPNTPPPPLDYAPPPTTTDAVPADPKRVPDVADADVTPKAADAMPLPPKRPEGDGKKPTDDLKAAAAGPAIDPETVRGAIDKLVERIREQSGALDLIEQVGLSVVPASLGGIVGPGAGGPDLSFSGALDTARAIREGVFGAGGRMSEFVGGTTSAQVLRLLGHETR